MVENPLIRGSESHGAFGVNIESIGCMNMKCGGLDVAIERLR